MKFKDLQAEIHNWNGEKFPKAPSYLALLKILEELGELSSHYIGRIEQRVGKPEQDHQKELEDAIGDVAISLCVFCEREGIDFDKVISDTWAKVSKRTFVMRTSEERL